MKKVGWSLCLLTLAAGGVAGWRAWAAEPKKVVQPTDLLPADSAMYLHVAGASELKGAVEKSAAYESLKASGLIDYLSSLIQQGAAQAVSDAGAPKETGLVLSLIGKAFSHAWDHGLYVGVDLKLLIGEAALVLPDAVQTGLAAEVDKQIREIAKVTETSLREETIEGRKVAILKLDPFLLSWWNEGPHTAVVVNMIGPGAPIRRAIGREPSFTGSERAKRYQTKAAYAVGGEFWLDMTAILKLFPRVEPLPKVVDYMGIESIQAIRFVWGYEGPTLRTDVDLFLGKERKGLLSTVDAPPVAVERLPRLPADVENVLMFSMDGEYLYDKVGPAVVEGFRLFNPDEAKHAQQQLEHLDQILGISLKNDVTKHFGPTAVLYSSPVDGPFGVAGITVAVEIKNHAALKESLGKLAAAIPSQIPGSILETTSSSDADLWICHLGDATLPISPTVGLTQRWLIVGATSPSSVLRFIRLQSNRQAAAWATPKAFGVEANRPKAKLIAAQYSDPRPTVRMLTSVLPTVTSMIRTRYPSVTVDWNKAPDVDRILSPLFPSVGTICVDEEGLHISHRSSLPIPSLGSDGGGLASLVILGAMVSPEFRALPSRGIGNSAGERNSPNGESPRGSSDDSRESSGSDARKNASADED